MIRPSKPAKFFPCQLLHPITQHPVYLRLAPKPRDLPFCIAARRTRQRAAHLCLGRPTVEVCEDLAIPDRIGGHYSTSNTFRFLEKAGRKHRLDSACNAFFE